MKQAHNIICFRSFGYLELYIYSNIKINYTWQDTNCFIWDTGTIVVFSFLIRILNKSVNLGVPTENYSKCCHSYINMMYVV